MRVKIAQPSAKTIVTQLELVGQTDRRGSLPFATDHFAVRVEQSVGCVCDCVCHSGR